LQVRRLKQFKRKNAARTENALGQQAAVVGSGENTFSLLLEAVEVCSLGQITERLEEVVGRFRPMV
jgi:methylmalonyl-CoA mutase